jgi:hypothetical protein
VPKQLSFPPVDPAWEFDRDVVRFYAVVDNKTVVCNVSLEALFEHFGVRKPDASEAIRAFTTHRAQIEEVARKKIERELKPGQREILLRASDFRPAATTTTTPAPAPRFESNLSDAVRDNPEIREVVQEANRVIAEDLARGRDHVAGAWSLVSGSSSPLLQLRLTDAETQASVAGYFTPEDLRSSSVARFALFRLWDDLLREKTAKLLAHVREGA